MISATVAVTGATGFVGRPLVAALRAAGHAVRALVRRQDEALAATGAELVPGSLADEASLRALVQGADAVVHVAGAINAPDRAGFLAANAAGTARLAEAAASALPGRPFIHVSSLAAREPHLSPYGESKALGEAEARARADRLAITIVRPPAVYGPGDRATLPIIQGLARGWLAAPAGTDARFSLLHVEDLARLLVAMLGATLPPAAVLEPDDGRAGGYGWRDLADIAERVLGRRVRLVPLPRAPLFLAAGLLERYARARGQAPLLWRGKVAELFHPDWVCDPATMTALPGWRPSIGFARGLSSTLAWYREAGWL
ncbi:NAD-dependent epimerase/dehydratase family protein [Benzoatithermus flavus]|uniref:NAD-dependent epimerase/dehydratase family protein n=1 Tax=Benzoatithermus flavus TaxID=3108223 RepID=A0ABU8XMQ6_9PROT